MTATPPPNFEDYVSGNRLAELIQQAREEDLGADGVDVTSALFVPSELRGDASVVAREPGTLAGGALLHAVAAAYDTQIDTALLIEDGAPIKPGDVAATLSGPMRGILSAERIALNLLTHLSGVATMTASYVRAVAGTNARVYDTRKTLPGLRGLQKYAVACGGGGTHRMGLYDAALLKDNHLAHIDASDLPQAVADAVQRSRAEHPNLKFVMVEVDNLEQLSAVLPSEVDIVLLDNMDNTQLTKAVAMRDSVAKHVQLEASGGVTLDTINGIANTGVDRISVGALTHSAASLDLGLDIR